MIDKSVTATVIKRGILYQVVKTLNHYDLPIDCETTAYYSLVDHR